MYKTNVKTIRDLKKKNLSTIIHRKKRDLLMDYLTQNLVFNALQQKTSI